MEKKLLAPRDKCEIIVNYLQKYGAAADEGMIVVRREVNVFRRSEVGLSPPPPPNPLRSHSSSGNKQLYTPQRWHSKTFNIVAPLPRGPP